MMNARWSPWMTLTLTLSTDHYPVQPPVLCNWVLQLHHTYTHTTVHSAGAEVTTPHIYFRRGGHSFILSCSLCSAGEYWMKNEWRMNEWILVVMVTNLTQIEGPVILLYYSVCWCQPGTKVVKQGLPLSFRGLILEGSIGGEYNKTPGGVTITIHHHYPWRCIPPKIGYDRIGKRIHHN